MKYVINQQTKKSVWILTKGMVETLKTVSITFDQLDSLVSYTDKLMPAEIVSILKLQDIIAGKLGAPTLPVNLSGLDVVNQALLERAFNDVRSEDLQQHFTAHNKFYVHSVHDGIVLCLANKDDGSTLPGWEPLAADTLVSALLEGLYKKFGYNEVHFNDAVKTSLGEFSVANIFNLMAVSH